MDRLLLIAATLCFVASFGYTLYALGAGRFRPGRVNLVAILAGFLFQSAFLYLRGQAEGSCPLNSLYDVLIFLSWALVLIYLLVGPAYRLSLLGAFTSPLAFLLVLTALIAPLDHSVKVRPVLNPWIETHAALSIIAYGAFGLACVAGIMYLLQERQLKAHKASSLLYNLPPINHLAAAIARLVGLGCLLLTISFAAGFISQMPVNSMKFLTSAAIWLVYGLIFALHRFRNLAPRRLAELSIVVFALVLLTLPGIQYLSSRP
ncbi:MAG TPA: cytochrome c biogenesis protein CcsA [Terrimicrobiaceae bacterium]|nr:cytochrome c biogenesis protein CcsA [Terrimicrobiaceae bacterium]